MERKFPFCRGAMPRSIFRLFCDFFKQYRWQRALRAGCLARQRVSADCLAIKMEENDV